MLRIYPPGATFWRGSGWGDPASVGPNGAGKSTLLARMAGMTRVREAFSSRGNPWKHGPQQNCAASRLSFTTADAAVCNAGLHYLTLHQHDKTRTELLNDVAGRWLLMTNSDVAPINFPAVMATRTSCCGGAANHTTSQSRGQLLLLDEPMNSLDVAQQSA